MGFPPIFRAFVLMFSIPFFFSGCAPGEPPSQELPPSQEVPFVRSGSLVETTEYAARRQSLMDEIPDGIAIIPGSDLAPGWRSVLPE